LKGKGLSTTSSGSGESVRKKGGRLHDLPGGGLHPAIFAEEHHSVRALSSEKERSRGREKGMTGEIASGERKGGLKGNEYCRGRSHQVSVHIYNEKGTAGKRQGGDHFEEEKDAKGSFFDGGIAKATPRAYGFPIKADR